MLQVVANDGGEGSLPATARVVITVRDVNDKAPQIRFETTSGGTGSDVTWSLRLSEHGPARQFVAHMTVKDPDSGNAGRVHCTMPSSQFTLVRMIPNEYKVSSTSQSIN